MSEREPREVGDIPPDRKTEQNPPGVDPEEDSESNPEREGPDEEDSERGGRDERHEPSSDRTSSGPPAESIPGSSGQSPNLRH
jgi:hypothetical protein